MGLYSPVVPPDARPPIGYPPEWRLSKLVQSVSFFSLGVVVAQWLRGLQVAGCNLAGMYVLSSAAYATVSSVYMERKDALGSRYGSRREFMKLFALLPLVWTIAVRYTFPFNNLALYGFGMWCGTHFAFLDRIAVLQSFGCKVVHADGWRAMNMREALVGMVLVTVVCGTTWAHAQYWMEAKEELVEVLVGYAAVGVGLLVVGKVVLRDCSFHSHHYFNFLMLLPLTRFEHVGAALCQSVILGSIVEGIAVWGMDPIFHNSLWEGTDQATVFWTNLVLVMGPTPRRWHLTLRGVQILFRGFLDLAESDLEPEMKAVLPLVRDQFARLCDDVVFLSKLAYKGKQGDMDGSNACTMSRASKDALFLETAANVGAGMRRNKLQAMAFLDTIVQGLFAGSQDLFKLGLGSLGLEPGMSQRALGVVTPQENQQEALVDYRWRMLRMKEKLSSEEKTLLFRLECALVELFSSVAA